MSCLKQEKPQSPDEKSTVNDQAQLRRQLLEMIRRNEEMRRVKSK
jgi:hypothetical protein